MSAERNRPALRAIRREPLLVDDREVAERLHARTPLPAETARWARAWLVCWFATLAADERFGRDDPWEIPLRLDLVTVPKGGGDAARQRAVLSAFADAGIARVHEEARGRRSISMAYLAPEIFTEHAAAVSVDWESVVAGCGAEPAALLVMRALAELLVPPDAPSAVPRRDLMTRTGYQQKQVRVALRRLEAADLIFGDGDVGTTARYHLTPRALGRRWPSAEPDATPAFPPAAPASRAAAAPMAVPANPTPTLAGGEGVRLVIGGATVTIAAGAAFEIGPGVSARLEVGPDGQPRLVVGPPTR